MKWSQIDTSADRKQSEYGWNGARLTPVQVENSLNMDEIEPDWHKCRHNMDEMEPDWHQCRQKTIRIGMKWSQIDTNADIIWMKCSQIDTSAGRNQPEYGWNVARLTQVQTEYGWNGARLAPVQVEISLNMDEMEPDWHHCSEVQIESNQSVDERETACHFYTSAGRKQSKWDIERTDTRANNLPTLSELLLAHMVQWYKEHRFIVLSPFATIKWLLY